MNSNIVHFINILKKDLRESQIVSTGLFEIKDPRDRLLNKSEISKEGTWCMFVIGHYSGKISNPEKINSFVEKLKVNKIKADWAVCAFDKEEISCLRMAIKLGGKIRVGFENSMLMPDGKIAPNNETKVKEANNLFD